MLVTSSRSSSGGRQRHDHHHDDADDRGGDRDLSDAVGCHGAPALSSRAVRGTASGLGEPRSDRPARTRSSPRVDGSGAMIEVGGASLRGRAGLWGARGSPAARPSGPEAEDEGEQLGDGLVEVGRDQLADLAGPVEGPGEDGLVDDRDAVRLGLRSGCRRDRAGALGDHLGRALRRVVLQRDRVVRRVHDHDVGAAHRGRSSGCG